MDKRLARRLSPTAIRLLRTGAPEDMLEALLSIGAGADMDLLTRDLESVSAAVLSKMPEAGCVSVRLPIRAIEDVARLRDVSYVDAVTRYAS